jgi:EpsI family protein
MIGKGPFLAVYLLLAATALYLGMHHNLQVPPARALSLFPATLNGWRMDGEFLLSDEVQKLLRATDYLSRGYVDSEGRKVTLYVGYHSGGKDSGEIHSPKHCLPGSGWFEISSTRKELSLSGQKLNLVQSVYRKGENSELFLYWFQVRGNSVSSEYALKVAQVLNSLLHRRRDASFIRISVPFEGDQQKAQATGERFLREIYPHLTTFFPL